MSKICSALPADRMVAPDALLRGVPEDDEDDEDEEGKTRKKAKRTTTREKATRSKCGLAVGSVEQRSIQRTETCALQDSESFVGAAHPTCIG